MRLRFGAKEGAYGTEIIVGGSGESDEVGAGA